MRDIAEGMSLLWEKAHPNLYAHQGHMPYWHILMEHGQFSDQGQTWTPSSPAIKPCAPAQQGHRELRP